MVRLKYQYIISHLFSWVSCSSLECIFVKVNWHNGIIQTDQCSSQTVSVLKQSSALYCSEEDETALAYSQYVHKIHKSSFMNWLLLSAQHVYTAHNRPTVILLIILAHWRPIHV